MSFKRGDYIYYPKTTKAIHREIEIRLQNAKQAINPDSKVWKSGCWSVRMDLLQTCFFELERCHGLVDVLEGRAR